jgi:hypothetical protein
MTPSIPEPSFEQIKDCLFQGNKIEAIKIYRQFAASSLADAKTAVERLEDGLRGATPEKFNAPASPRHRSFRPSDFGMRDVPLLIISFLILSVFSVGFGLLSEQLPESSRFAIVGFVAGIWVGLAISKWSSRSLP